MVRPHSVGDMALRGSCLVDGYPWPLGLSHAGPFLDAGPVGRYMARHDDHDHDPPQQPPPRPSGAGGRSLIVTRAAEGPAAHLQIPAPILVVVRTRRIEPWLTRPGSPCWARRATPAPSCCGC